MPTIDTQCEKASVPNYTLFFSKCISYGRQVSTCQGKNDKNAIWLVYHLVAVTDRKPIVKYNKIAHFLDFLVQEEGKL